MFSSSWILLVLSSIPSMKQILDSLLSWFLPLDTYMLVSILLKTCSTQNEMQHLPCGVLTMAVTLLFIESLNTSSFYQCHHMIGLYWACVQLKSLSIFLYEDDKKLIFSIPNLHNLFKWRCYIYDWFNFILMMSLWNCFVIVIYCISNVGLLHPQIWSLWCLHLKCWFKNVE